MRRRALWTIGLMMVLPPAAPGAPSPAPRPGLTPATVCPPNRSRGSGCAHQQNRGVVGLGTRPLRRTLRHRAGGWRQAKVYEWGAGVAGRCADSVRAEYRQGSRTLTVTLTDMIRVCTCQAGTGQVMTTSAGYRAPGTTVRRLTVHGLPARLHRHRVADTLFFWVGDRCHVVLEAPHAIAEAGLRRAVGALDLKALTALCRRR